MILLSAPVSPVTGLKNTVFVESLDVKKICEAYQAEFGLDVTGYFKSMASLEIWKCRDTGYRFYSPFSLAGDGGFYDALYRTKSRYDHERPEHKEALRFMRPKDRILEIGSGSGFFLKTLRNQGYSFCSGLETSPRARALAKNEGLEILNEDLPSLAEIRPAAYDVICAFQVLEHMGEVRAFLHHVLRLVRPGGKIIFSVPNNNPYLYRWDKYHTLNLPPHHMGLWNASSLKRLKKYFSFRLLFLKVMPLQEGDLKKVLHFQSRLREFLLNAKPARILILKTLRYFCQGRDILTVYQKTA